MADYINRDELLAHIEHLRELYKENAYWFTVSDVLDCIRRFPAVPAKEVRNAGDHR